MIAALEFGRARRGTGGRLERQIAFAPRSDLPLSAVCLVANNVREQFARMLGRELQTEAIEPVIVDRSAPSALFADAIVQRVSGRTCDVLIAVRRADASTLVGAAFHENDRSPAQLSAIERATLERLLAVLPPLCVPLCGPVAGARTEDAGRALADAVTYFEVRFTGAMRAAIAFALTEDPREHVVASVTLEDLLDVEFECAVECARGSIALSALGRLSVGTTLPLDTSLGGSGTLLVDRTPFARGACGLRGDRAAFVVDRPAAA
jgi:flagellar motor switch/type III secretory pathway protein FliN